MLRADVCNAVDELGQLLDHTGPVAASERNAARIFNADHCFFVTNGTSTSNKMVWHHTVAPGDVVVVDRNCHKSILHAIIMTGAMPVFLKPTRNHFGIIGPIPQSEFEPEAIQAQDRAPTRCSRGVDAEQGQAAHPDAHAEHLRRRALQHRDHQGHARRLRRHAALRRGLAAARGLPPVLRRLPRDGQVPRAAEGVAGLSRRSRRTSCWPASARPVHVLVQDSQNRKLDRHLFNEAYLMHTSTSPQYAIIASCDVAAAMMEPPGGTALVEESILEALDFRRAMRKVDEEFGKRLVVQGLGAGQARRRGHRQRATTGCSRPSDEVARLRRPGRRLQHARPDQVHDHHARARRLTASSPRPASRRRIVTKFLAEHGVVVEKTGPLLVLHHVHHRHHQGPLEHAC